MNNKRSGFTLTETVVAGIILSTAIAVSMQMLVATSAQHQTMEQGRIALLEAGNVVERLSVLPWSKLDADELSAWNLGPQAARALPGGKLEIQVQPTSDEPAAKRLTVVVSYSPKEKQPARSVRLVTWRYADAIATPPPEGKNENK